jgi:Ca2+-binding RTX toxin-like protein
LWRPDEHSRPIASGGDGEFDYSFVWADSMLATGAFVTVNGSTLGVNETMVFDGSDETGGRFRLFGGASADTLTGGGGHDFLFGGAGGDTLRGNGGADRLLYYKVSDSMPGAGNFDVMLDFEHERDLIDVSVIDADSTIDGNQAFAFIGSSAFSGAGQLRVELIDAATNRWKVEADVDGNGSADLYLEVVVQAGQPLTASDFYL